MNNPYDQVLQSCANISELQQKYEEHRQSRNLQQRTKLSSSGLKRLEPDPILQALLRQDGRSVFIDPRHNLVFWARPTSRIRSLINEIQLMLIAKAPNLWLMPLDCLHMTVLEIVHSTTATVVQNLLEILQPRLQDIVDYPSQHPVRLIKPTIGYDASALALTFVPVANECSGGDTNTSFTTNSYSYHHLRRDIYDLSKSTGVQIASRYTALSAHLTIARFTSETEFTGRIREDQALEPSLMKNWLSCIDSINGWLKDEFWPNGNDDVKPGGEWIVGQENGLECRVGACWYGGGETVALGRVA